MIRPTTHAQDSRLGADSFFIVYSCNPFMGTGIGYRNEAHARMKGWYGTGKICKCLTSLIKTIGGEFSERQRIPITIMRILAYNISYPKTVLGPVPYPLCPVPVYDVVKVQKLESYDHLTLF